MSDLSLGGGIRLPEACKGDRATQVGSTKHFTGGLVLGDGPGERHGVESHAEKCAALILSYRRSTLELRTQVRFEWSDKFGELHNHYIDLVTLQTDGAMIGYAVRPKDRASNRYIQELARIKKQAVSQGFLDNLLLFTEDDVCPVELFNAKLFHSVRGPDCFGDTVAQDVVRSMTGVVSVGDLVASTRLDGMGFRAIARLICSGHLEMLSYERITHTTMVFKKKEV
ncbi:hypothetical protein [Tropicibacter oceani]|uniref:Uncharacterized protein n=1 Tax=Tropicibacter oceani TaxID=3058420 RepID=A0ABY8QH39_9RHOB|nr:hypothetical protein [Tropicibacter oceani]WGW03949.1 hypothetical protein QF118_18855 [Tropicibacter oceani]